MQENIQTISNYQFTVDELRPVSYTLKSNQKPALGFIAHEVQEIFPDIVFGNKDAEQYQTINYTSMFPLIVKEIKDMKREISDLKTKLRQHGIDTE